MRTVNPNHPTRLKILTLVRKDPGMSLNESARAIGSSRTTVRYHVGNLDRDGLIQWRVTERGHRGRYLKIRKPRAVSSEKLTEYAKQGRGKKAFIPRKAKKDSGLQARIERVVKKALAKAASGAGYDVVRHNPHRLRLRLVAKLG